MNIPFFPYAKVRKAYPEAVAYRNEIEKKGQFILGRPVEEFEEKLAEKLGVSYAVGLNSGTDALLLALAAAGVGSGDEVITVSHTFIATIQVIKHLGANPILVDIDDHGLIDEYKMREAITERTKAIVPVHLEGNRRTFYYPLPSSLSIIHDGAQAITASPNNGFATCYSFYPAKILGAFGDAGALVTNHEDVATEVRRLRNHYDIGKGGKPPFRFGWNSRLDAGHAAVLTKKLDRIYDDIMRRHAVASMYHVGLKETPLMLPEMNGYRVFQDYVIRSKERNELAAYLTSHHIGILGHDLLPNHLHKGLGLEHFHLPKTEEYLRQQIRIPCNQFITDREVFYVIKIIRRFYGM